MRERVDIYERLRLCFGGVEGREALPSTSHWGTTNPLDLGLRGVRYLPSTSHWGTTNPLA